MKLTSQIINCSKRYVNTCRKSPFSVILYKLNYSSSVEDKGLIDSLLVKAADLAGKVNPRAANDSLHNRNNNRVYANCIAGVVSEYFWRLFLNSEEKIVSETPLVDRAAQIDLLVVANDKKIEVRSSFPRNGIEFAICHPYYEFDILGPYSNSYKPGEVQKDYYVRTLFHLDRPTDIISKIKEDDFSVYLTGGATWDMMMDDRYSKNKSLIPEDSIFTEKISNYRVVPFRNALDTIQMKNVIRQDISVG